MRGSIIVLTLAGALAGFAGVAPAQVRPSPPDNGQVRGNWYDNGRLGDPDEPGSGYDQDGAAYGYGYEVPPYRPQAPYQGGQPGMPSYQDDERYGASDTYDSTDARGASQGLAAPVPPARTSDAADYRRQQARYRAQLDEYHRRMRAYRGAYGNPYGDRAAELRARADACERGDDAACG